MSDPDLGDLPGLRQWGDDLRAATSRAEQEQGRRAPRRRVPVRRLGLALVAIFVIVPGAAVGTRSIWDDPVQQVAPLAKTPTTPAVRLAQGTANGVDWRVGGYDASGDRQCLQLDILGGDRPRSVRGCAPRLTRASITLFSAPAVGFVYGTVSVDVRSVEVAVPGGRRLRVGTTGVSADVVRRSRMRGGFRVYVAPFAEGFADTRQPQVTAYDGAGHAVGALGPR